MSVAVVKAAFVSLLVSLSLLRASREKSEEKFAGGGRITCFLTALLALLDPLSLFLFLSCSRRPAAFVSWFSLSLCRRQQQQ